MDTNETKNERAKEDTDGQIAIIVAIAILFILAVGGYYLWKYRRYFGFEGDKR